MEVLPEGKNFRLVQEEELPDILNFLSQFLPGSMKVNIKLFLCSFVLFVHVIFYVAGKPALIDSLLL